MVSDYGVSVSLDFILRSVGRRQSMFEWKMSRGKQCFKSTGWGKWKPARLAGGEDRCPGEGLD